MPSTPIVPRRRVHFFVDYWSSARRSRHGAVERGLVFEPHTQGCASRRARTRGAGAARYAPRSFVSSSSSRPASEFSSRRSRPSGRSATSTCPWTTICAGSAPVPVPRGPPRTSVRSCRAAASIVHVPGALLASRRRRRHRARWRRRLRRTDPPGARRPGSPPARAAARLVSIARRNTPRLRTSVSRTAPASSGVPMASTRRSVARACCASCRRRRIRSGTRLERTNAAAARVVFEARRPRDDAHRVRVRVPELLSRPGHAQRRRRVHANFEIARVAHEHRRSMRIRRRPRALRRRRRRRLRGRAHRVARVPLHVDLVSRRRSRHERRRPPEATVRRVRAVSMTRAVGQGRARRRLRAR